MERAGWLYVCDKTYIKTAVVQVKHAGFLFIIILCILHDIGIHVYSNYNVCLHMHCMNSTLLALSIKCHCGNDVVSKSNISKPSYLGTHT